MELWIRGQNKEVLTKTERIIIEEAENKFVIIHFDNKDNWIKLGVYDTKERALEVLDEIQRHLVVINDKNDNLFYVYEMPVD